jgi:hypothetical protein
MKTLQLTDSEAAALSAAAVWADGSHEHPALQSARVKLRALLDGTARYASEADRYVNTEC